MHKIQELQFKKLNKTARKSMNNIYYSTLTFTAFNPIIRGDESIPSGFIEKFYCSLTHD